MSTTDVDLSEFEGPDRVSRCKLGRIMEELDADHHQRLKAAIEMKDDSGLFKISAERIVTALHGWGYTVRETTVKTHRRKVCACAR